MLNQVELDHVITYSCAKLTKSLADVHFIVGL
jgi:hypothetical protein